MGLLKKILFTAFLLALGLGFFYYKGWIELTPEGKKVGQKAVNEGKNQVKRGAAWLLESAFETKSRSLTEKL